MDFTFHLVPFDPDGTPWFASQTQPGPATAQKQASAPNDSTRTGTTDDE